MTGCPPHGAAKLIRHTTGAFWTITCDCGETFQGSDPILAHDRHNQHQLENHYEETR